MNRTWKYRGETATTEVNRAIELLAVLSNRTNFQVGCHRAVVRVLLIG